MTTSGSKCLFTCLKQRTDFYNLYIAYLCAVCFISAGLSGHLNLSDERDPGHLGVIGHSPCTHGATRTGHSEQNQWTAG